MADPFLGEIRMVASNFAPTGWALCNGQTLSIAQNTALFSLLGTFYGGNGTTNFALPNLQGAGPMHSGNGAGLSTRFLGDTGGKASVVLTAAEMPTHTHPASGTAAPATAHSPQAALPAIPDASPRFRDLYRAGPVSGTESAAAIGVTGGSAAHNNLQPYLVLNFIIALEGIYPARD